MALCGSCSPARAPALRAPATASGLCRPSTGRSALRFSLSLGFAKTTISRAQNYMGFASLAAGWDFFRWRERLGIVLILSTWLFRGPR